MYIETLNETTPPVEETEDLALKEAIEHLQKGTAARKAPSKVVAEKAGPLDDTDWWQGPLDQVIGRQSRDITQKFYPQTFEEVMKATSDVDQNLKEALK